MDSNEHEPPAGEAPPPDGDVQRPADDAQRPPRAPGIAGLSAPYRVITALALAVVAIGACWHLALVFLHVAPSNTLSKQNAGMVDGWIYPEFEQNWKLFAPNPLQQNIAVEVRVEVRNSEGRLVTGNWRGLSREDGEAIRHSLLPSHTKQNELRRAWDFFTASHDEDNKSNGDRGELAEQYLRRIALDRLKVRTDADTSAGKAAHMAEGRIVRIQLRGATETVAAPKWSEETADTQTYYRELPWWTV